MRLRPIVPAGMVYAVSPTGAVIMGDLLMYVVLPVAVVGSLGRVSISGLRRRSGWGLRSADDLLANNARYAESFDRGNLPLPLGPYLLLSDPNTSVHSPEGKIGGNRDGAR